MDRTLGLIAFNQEAADPRLRVSTIEPGEVR